MAGAFLYANRVTQGVSLSSSHATIAAMPLSNLLDDQPRTRLRLVGTATGGGFAASLVVDLLAQVTLDCVALISTTLDSAASAVTVRARLATADTTGVAGDAWDSGTVTADTGEAANGNVVLVRSAGPATGRYLLVEVGAHATQAIDLGRLVAGPLWRLTRSHGYGITEGRLMLDRRDRNGLTGAEFAVPALHNPRTAAFTLPVLTAAEARGEHRELVRLLGAAGDALWVPDLALSRSEMNLRSLWGAVALPGEVAGTTHAAFPIHNRGFRLTERV